MIKTLIVSLMELCLVLIFEMIISSFVAFNINMVLYLISYMMFDETTLHFTDLMQGNNDIH